MKRIALSFLGYLFAFALFPNTSLFTVKGQLFEEDRQTIPYATISVAKKETPQKTMQQMASDDEGRFTLSLAEGEYLLSFHFIGKELLTKAVDCVGTTKQINLGEILLKDSKTQLKELDVVAQKTLVKVEIDKLTYDVQNDPEASTSNVLDLLRKVPLITIDADENIELKGSTNFKVYMNGKPSSMLTTEPSQVLKSMPANSIKDIEVITDPGAKHDAEGVGGIINIITEKRMDEGYTGSVGAGVNNYGGYNADGFLTMKYGKFGFAGNGSYNKRKSPLSNSYFLREDFDPNPTNVLEQKGTSKNQRENKYINTTISYELDTLNLFNITIGYYGGKRTSANDNSTNSKGVRNYSYDMHTNNIGGYGGTDVSADYQRIFKKKDELLTISYRFGHNPDDRNNATNISNTTGDSPYVDGYKQKGLNKGYGLEHTTQIDYANPLTKNHSIETGVKYIFRDNVSIGKWDLWNPSSQQWENDLKRKNDLNHKQHISSGYAGYSYKNGTFGAKAGVRAEHTHQKATFSTQTDTTIQQNYFDVVPSLAFSLQPTRSQTIRWGYNMRIYRPGIWHLSPYRDESNPLSISYGNPKLGAEKNHDFNISYGSFSQKFNFNLTLNYSLMNNAISSYQFIEDGITQNTYENIGIRQSTGASTYINWSPTNALRIYGNSTLNYTLISSKKMNQKRQGINGRVFAGADYNFLKSWQAGIKGGFFSRPVDLQSKRSPFYFSSMSIRKSFFDKKLDLALSFDTPFWQQRKRSSTINGKGFNQESYSIRPDKRIGLQINYRFGELKTSVKKVQRGIKNNDLKSSNNGSQDDDSEK